MKKKTCYRSQPNYELKAQVLKTDICKRLKKLDRENFLNSSEGIIQDYELDNRYIDLLFEYGEEYIKEGRKINLSNYKRTQRLRKRISEYLLEGPCIWLTLNFSDSVLENTNDISRRQYVREFLKPYKKYIANIDFGNDNEYIDRKGNKRKGTSREHYHAIVRTDIDIDMKKWSHGFAFTERIRNNEKSIKRLPKYITKLTNHAVKESTKRCHIIYSRKVSQ